MTTKYEEGPQWFKQPIATAVGGDVPDNDKDEIGRRPAKVESVVRAVERDKRRFENYFCRFAASKAARPLRVRCKPAATVCGQDRH